MYKEKIENLQNQKSQVKLEISELKDVLGIRDKLLNKIDGALEMLVSLQKEEEDSKKNNKKDKN